MAWYCIQTKPLREFRAASRLRSEFGFDVYVPLVPRRNSASQDRQANPTPLFPRYIFCRFDLASYRRIRYAPDVVDIVHVGDRPAIIEDQTIASLRQVSAEQCANIESDNLAGRQPGALATASPGCGTAGAVPQLEELFALLGRKPFPLRSR